MRILIVSPIFPPESRGPATYTFELSRRLKNCAVITFTQNPKRLRTPVFSVPQSGGTILRQWRLLAKILTEGKNRDIIYAQGADVVGLTSVFAGKLLQKPVVIKFVGDLFDELKRDLGKTNYFVKVATFVSLHLADRIIFPARHLKEDITKKYHLPPAKTIVIYNAVDD